MAFDPYTIPVNDVISINGVLWTNTGTTVGPLFPPLTLSYTWVPQSIYRLTTDYPDMAAGRDIALQGYGPNGWYDMWRGSEDDLPVDIDLSGLVFTGIRARYTLDNGCEYLSTGTIVCEPNVPDIQEVIGAVDTSEREAIEAAGPEIGDSYLVVSGESNLTWNAGYIVTWGVGAYWDAELVHEGDFVLANNTSVYWLMYLGELVQIVPPLVFTEAIPDVSFSLVSAYPTYATYMNRSVVVTAVIGGSTVTVYEGLEGYFSVPRLFTFDGAVTDISITYTKGPCSWTAGFVEGVCGDIEVTVEANEDCDTATYFVTVDITSVTNYPLGNQYATVNGVAQAPQPASIGPSVLGPFAFSDVVFVTIENSYNVACNYVSDTIIHPQAPEVDYLVSMAVDASLQAVAPPSAAYYIVSNVNSVVNTWSIHVGDVWTGTDWVTPSDGDVIRAESPSGVAGYWQQVSGGAVQIFPPGLFTYNTVTQVTVVSIEEVAPFIAGSDIVIQASCGVPEEIYSGPIASFTPFGFSPVCDIDVLTGTLNYFNPCWIPVGVNVESFTPTGDPEPFATTGLNSAVQFIFPQDDGKFICVGLFTLYGATSAPRVTRLNADGTLDTAFNTNIGTGPVGGAVRSAAIDSLGRVYVAGDFTSFNGNSSYPYLVRLLTDGTIDTSFVVGTSFNASVYNVMVQPDDDKVIAIGTFITYNSVTANRIIRLETDGSTDVTFNSGTGFNGPSNAPSGASKIDANGTILVSAGFGWTAYDGNIVLPGGPNPGIVRINPDGSFNSSLTQGTVFNGTINNLSVQSDGMYLITGAFTMYNGTAVPYIARLDDHGVLDTTFNIGVGVGFSVPATSNTPLPNGQMLIGTGGGTYQGLDTFRLVRLNNDGTRDFSYNTGPGFNDYVTQTVIMPLGNILVSGNFTTYNGLPRIRVALLN